MEIPDDFTEKEKERLKKLQEEIKNEIDKARARRFKDEVNSNPLLKKNKVKAVDWRSYLFFKVSAIIFLASLIGIGSWFGYMAWEGKLNTDILLNNTIINKFDPNVNVNNDYQFSPTTNNQYNHTIYIENKIVCPDDSEE